MLTISLASSVPIHDQLVAGLRGLGAGGTFEGVALYAEWTTDAAEWSAYERYWRNQPE